MQPSDPTQPPEFPQSPQTPPYQPYYPPPGYQPPSQPLYPQTPPPSWPQVPQTAPPLPPQGTRQGLRRIPVWGWIVGGVILTCVVCGSCATLVSLANGGTGGIANATATLGPERQATVASTSVPTSAPTAVPTPTADTQQADYIDVVSKHSTTVGDDFTAVSDICGSGTDLSGCRDATQTAHDDTVAFLSALNAHPAPSCLSKVDKLLRTALGNYKNGTQLVLDGIDQIDTDKIDQGSALIKKGTTGIDDAVTAVGDAHC